MSQISAIEFLYGIEAGHEVGNEWVPTQVVTFRVTRRTPRRIYYLPQDWGQPKERFVDRVALEADGQVSRSSAGWWEPDITVYLHPPVLEQAEKPGLAQLKAAMAEAHPDRGGSDAAFIAARARYELARSAAVAS